MLFRIKLCTKPIFRIFHILKINRIMPFYNFFMGRPSYSARFRGQRESEWVMQTRQRCARAMLDTYAAGTGCTGSVSRSYLSAKRQSQTNDKYTTQYSVTAAAAAASTSTSSFSQQWCGNRMHRLIGPRHRRRRRRRREPHSIRRN